MTQTHLFKDRLMDNARDEAVRKISKGLKVDKDIAQLLADCIAYAYYDGCPSAEKLCSKCWIYDSEIFALLNKEKEFIKEYDNETVKGLDCMVD